MKKHIFWLDRYYDLFPIHHIFISILTSILIFLSGLGLSYLIDFQYIYMTTIPVYLAIFGIAWVGSWIRWASFRTRDMIGSLQIGFLVENKEYTKFRNKWLRKFNNNKLYLIISSISIASAWVFIWFYSTRSTIPWFPEAWSEDPYLWTKNIIIDIFAVPIGLLVNSTGIAIVIFSLFVSDLAKFSVVPMIDYAKANLRPVVQFGIAAGVSWSVGVSLFVIAFTPSFNILAAGMIFLLTTFGLLIILYPQYIIHGILKNLKRDMWRASTKSFYQELMPLNKGLDLGSIIHSQKMLPYYRFGRSLSGSNTWIYNPTDIATLIGSLLLPLVTLVTTHLF